MYNCYIHGWSNWHQQCPSCQTIVTVSSTEPVLECIPKLESAYVRELEAQIKQLIFERDEFEKIANSWMSAYDTIREKYEPTEAVLSEWSKG